MTDDILIKKLEESLGCGADVMVFMACDVTPAQQQRLVKDGYFTKTAGPLTLVRKTPFPTDTNG